MCIHTEEKKESDDLYYLYHPATGVDLLPLSPPPHYVKLWITLGMCMNREVRSVCLYACMCVFVTL